MSRARNTSRRLSNSSSRMNFPSSIGHPLESFPSFPRRHSDASSTGPNDKTVCQFCGLSYRTVSEINALQVKVKELQLNQGELKDARIANTKLKETLDNLTRLFKEETSKKDELILNLRDRQTNLEKELSSKTNRDNEVKSLREKIRVLESKLTSGMNTPSGDVYRGSKAHKNEDIVMQNTALGDRLRNLSSENAVSNELHSNLRETIEKLKDNNLVLNQENSSLRVKLEESQLNLKTTESKCEALKVKSERLQKTAKDREIKLQTAMNQNSYLKQSIDPNIVDSLQKSLTMLQKQFNLQKTEMERCKQEYESHLSAARNEIQFEKERADQCLVNSLHEREETERLWNERWARHQESLNEQIENLKSNYESILSCSRGNEITLEKELQLLKEKSQQNKDSWEKYRSALTEQIKEWKQCCESKHAELEALQKSKVDVELMYQEKTLELHKLHEIIEQGCEERHALQKELERKENEVDEIKLGQAMSISGSRAKSGSSKMWLAPPELPPPPLTCISLSSAAPTTRTRSDSEGNSSESKTSYTLVQKVDPDQSLGLFTVGSGKGTKEKKTGKGQTLLKHNGKSDSVGNPRSTVTIAKSGTSTMTMSSSYKKSTSKSKTKRM